MEEAVARHFNDKVLCEAAERFNVSADGAKLLGDFENYVYEVQSKEEPYILRLTHSSHRDQAQVLSELEWINFLSEQEISVAKAYPSTAGHLVEVVEAADTYFSVSLFEKAKGKRVDAKNNQEWNNELFRTWGETIGRMHSATKRYSPRHGTERRPEWDGDDLIVNFESYLSGQEEIIGKARALLRYFEALPKDLSTYGLQHTDVHTGNFFIDQGQMTVFDFDDCTYHWFVRDISIALYYSLWLTIPASEKQQRADFTDWFIPAFLDGYRNENELDPGWLTKIPEFLMLRDIELYAVLHKKWNLTNLSEGEQALLAELKSRILNSQPAVDVSFDKYL